MAHLKETSLNNYIILTSRNTVSKQIENVRCKDYEGDRFYVVGTNEYYDEKGFDILRDKCIVTGGRCLRISWLHRTDTPRPDSKKIVINDVALNPIIPMPTHLRAKSSAPGIVFAQISGNKIKDICYLESLLPFTQLNIVSLDHPVIYGMYQKLYKKCDEVVVGRLNNKNELLLLNTWTLRIREIENGSPLLR